mmetsp:Transcript_1215/g.2871  ORF Transcript_1215/g.2871 Transcript_1215/m.2871 type:complete len:167 (-) Transcript_1215:61-561(-)
MAHQRVTRPGLAVYFPPTKEEVEEISVAFGCFQEDEEGYIGYHDCKSAVCAMGFKVNRGELMKVIEELCEDASGERISREDFGHIAMRFIARRTPKDILQRDFGLFDAHGRGYIDVDDLRRVIKSVGGAMRSDAELHAMIAHFDANRDGRLDMGDFGDALGRTLGL